MWQSNMPSYGGEDYREPFFLSIIGVPLLEKDCFTVEKIKLFDHNYPEDWTVDPKTQQQLWAYLHHFNFSLIPKFDAQNQSNDLCYFLKGRHGQEDAIVYLGIMAQKKDNEIIHIPIENSNINQIKNKLKSILEPAGIYHERQFGLYSIVYSNINQEYTFQSISNR